MAASKCGSFTVGKGWRRTVGVKVGIDGRLMPCRFWLGMDKPRATATALAIESVWVGLNAPFWTPEALRVAEGIRVGQNGSDAPESKTDGKTPTITAMVPKATAVLTVKGLIERYRTAKVEDPSLSEPSKHSIRCRTRSLERSPIGDLPLASVGAEQLSATVAYWLGRPKTSMGNSVSEYSARMIVKTARAVFDWADAMNLWLAPRRFDRIFRLPKTTTAPTIQTYSIDDLKRLYGAANDRLKLMMLLGLNCGFCSAELATLKRSEIDLQAKVIERRRQKTKVPMRWKLWPETATMLERFMEHDGDLALRTDGGKPLVWFSDKGHRVDVIPNRWERLKINAQINNGSFKTLRKTAATLMRAIGGVEVSELFLAHSEKTVAKYYSMPSMEQMNKSLSLLRKQLRPMLISQGGMA